MQRNGSVREQSPEYNSIKLPNNQEIVTSDEAAGHIYHRSSNGTSQKLFHMIHRSEKTIHESLNRTRK